MNTFLLEILTPDKPFYRENVDMVIAKGQKGFLGILAHHAPLLTRLTPGPIRIKKNDTEQVLMTGAGLMEVTSDGVTVLADSAEPAPASGPAKVTN